MKIIHICISSPFSEIYAYQENLLAHYQKVMGHDVTIIAPIFSSVAMDKTEPIGERVLDDGTKLVRLAPMFKSKAISEHLQLVRGLKSAVLAEEPDLIFVHAVSCFNYKCLPSIKKVYPDVKIVFDNHADFINSLRSPITRFLHRVVYRYTLIPSLIKIAEYFYGVTPSRCSFLSKVYGIPEKKIKLLVMGADDENMRLEEKGKIRDEIRTKFGIKDNDFLVVTGGKIDPLKNIHVLAKAISNIQIDSIKLLIFGTISEELKEYFAKIQSDRIMCIGWQPSNEVYRYFYASDLVVFPGLHSVLWEQAVASQVPCAFTKIDGFDHIDIGGNCVLMDGNDENYYKELIESVYSNKGWYQSLLNHSHSDEAKRFYYSKIAKAVIDDCKG